MFVSLFFFSGAIFFDWCSIYQRGADGERSDDVDLDLSDIEGSGLADELADLDSTGYDANDSFIAADDDAAAVAAASDSDDATPVRRRRSSRRRHPARR